MSARWNVAAVGEYTIVVSGKYRSETGEYDVPAIQAAVDSMASSCLR